MHATDFLDHYDIAAAVVHADDFTRPNMRSGKTEPRRRFLIVFAYIDPATHLDRQFTLTYETPGNETVDDIDCAKALYTIAIAVHLGDRYEHFLCETPGTLVTREQWRADEHAAYVEASQWITDPDMWDEFLSLTMEDDVPSPRIPVPAKEEATTMARPLLDFIDPCTRKPRTTPPAANGSALDQWDNTRTQFLARWDTLTNVARHRRITAAIARLPHEQQSRAAIDTGHHDPLDTGHLIPAIGLATVNVDAAVVRLALDFGWQPDPHDPPGLDMTEASVESITVGILGPEPGTAQRLRDLSEAAAIWLDAYAIGRGLRVTYRDNGLHVVTPADYDPAAERRVWREISDGPTLNGRPARNSQEGDAWSRTFAALLPHGPYAVITHEYYIAHINPPADTDTRAPDTHEPNDDDKLVLTHQIEYCRAFSLNDIDGTHTAVDVQFERRTVAGTPTVHDAHRWCAEVTIDHITWNGTDE